MTREIKFRTWDRAIMCYPRYSEKHSDPIRRLLEFLQDKTNLSNCPEVILMQYTGLKDKWKKPIFEGDIIECSPGRLPTTYWEVFWGECTENGMFGWMVRTSTGEYVLDQSIITQGKIIGNIYENESLLTNKKE